MKRTLQLIVFCAAVAAAAPSHAAVRYSVTDLGALGSNSRALAISASGTAVGLDNIGHAFVYLNGGMQDLNSLIDPASGWTLHDAKAINAAGQIVGFGTGPQNGAYLYQDGTVTGLGTFPSSAGVNYGSEARGINDAGQVVGDAFTAGGDMRAFLYESGAMKDLGTLGGDDSRAYGISSAGQVVGYAEDASGNQRAFLYEGGAMADLGTLGGTRSIAHAINDAGQIVGFSTLEDGSSHAFLYENGAMKDLGAFPGGGGQRIAYAINSHGQIVGSAGGRAFIYEDGAMKDLNSLIDPASGWTMEYAYGINDAGQIVGYGNDGQSTRALLLTPGTAPLQPAPAPAAPSIRLSGKKKVKASKPKLSVAGTASGAVTDVVYRVGTKGAYRKASGTSKWRFTAKLKPGKNLITVIARGPGGSSKPLKVTAVLE